MWHSLRVANTRREFLRDGLLASCAGPVAHLIDQVRPNTEPLQHVQPARQVLVPEARLVCDVDAVLAGHKDAKLLDVSVQHALHRVQAAMQHDALVSGESRVRRGTRKGSRAAPG